MPTHIALYTQPNGIMIADLTRDAENIIVAENEHGPESLTFDVPIRLYDAFRIYNYPLLHVVVSDNGYEYWTGRLEKPGIAATRDGTRLRLTAYGYQRALSDAPYTALWSTTRSDEWFILDAQSIAATEPERFAISVDRNRLSIAPIKDTTVSNAVVGRLGFVTSSGSSRLITHVAFDYAYTGGVSPWTVGLQGLTSPYPATGAWSSAASLWSTTTAGTGSQSITLGTPKNALSFFLFYNTGTPAAFGGETNSLRLLITNLRITTAATPITADLIADDLVSHISGINSTQLSTGTNLIQSPGLDLRDEVYEDEYPSEILNRLVQLGDSQTPPRQWQWKVDTQRRLSLFPVGDNARSWFVDVDDLDLERDIEALRNSVYATYREASGRTLRTGTSANSASVNRYGITRRASVGSQSTSVLQAEVERDAYLIDNRDPLPRAAVSFERVYTRDGASAPLRDVKPGDTITVRNFPPSLSATTDKIRTFRVARREYYPNEGRISVTPEGGIASQLEMLLARRGERV